MAPMTPSKKFDAEVSWKISTGIIVSPGLCDSAQTHMQETRLVSDFELQRGQSRASSPPLHTHISLSRGGFTFTIPDKIGQAALPEH